MIRSNRNGYVSASDLGVEERGEEEEEVKYEEEKGGVCDRGGENKCEGLYTTR